MTSEKTKAINVSSDIYKRIERRAEVSDFDSAEEYVDHLLRVVLADLEPLSDSANEEEVMSRLESLGYLGQ